MIITLEVEGKRSWDLELPGDVPVGSILPRLFGALGIRDVSGALRAAGRPVSAGSTLAETGVVTGSILIYSRGGREAVAGGSLRLGSGRRVTLNDFDRRDVTLGRPGGPGGSRPDVDFTREPEGDTVSREHASLRASEAGWVLSIRSDRNRSEVNGQQVKPGETRVLRSGDIIRLGKARITFEA